MSAIFSYDDVIQSAREKIGQAANLRLTDDEIMDYHLPQALQNLRADRPDLWIGIYGSEAFKPTTQSGLLPFADEGFTPLVEALASVLSTKDDDPKGSQTSVMTDAKSERSRK